MVRDIHYFAYGTLQKGLSNYADMTDVLGEPAGRFRTAEAFAVVVRHEPGCSNPGCNLLHRMATLVSGVGSLRVEGDVYLVDAEGLRLIDRLENYEGEDGTGPYVRREIEVVSIDGRTQLTAHAYRVRDPAPWRNARRAGPSRRCCPLHRRHGNLDAQGVLRPPPRTLGSARHDRPAARQRRRQLSRDVGAPPM
jgi:gamma-glutamylcyclotransferase (GGCT)/AIG2-like uncharacterized protein YtfP